MKTKLVSLVLAAGAGVSMLPACTGTGSAYIVSDYEDPPPPMREEYVAYRPGYVWVHGNWDRDRGRWRWRDGYYERERTGWVWTDGRWTRNGRNWVWVRGTWRPQGEVVIRGRARF